MWIIAFVVGIGVGLLCAREWQTLDRKTVALQGYAQGIAWGKYLMAGWSREDCDRQAPCPYQD